MSVFARNLINLLDMTFSIEPKITLEFLTKHHLIDRKLSVAH